MSTLDEIEEVERQLESLKKKLLRSAGWQVTCDTPSSFWLWRREFPKYGMVLVSQDTAYDMTLRMGLHLETAQTIG